MSMPQLDKLVCRSATKSGVMHVYDNNERLMLTGRMNKQDMYECRVEFAKKRVSFNSILSKEGDDEVLLKDVVNLNVDIQAAGKGNVNVIKPQKYMNTVLRDRAIECRKLHNNLHHTNDRSLGDGLDNGCYPNTKLTSHDLRN